jgi:hypothetical protein
MKILETVIGSNHRLTQPQTVGKNPGAPTIYAYVSILSGLKLSLFRHTKILSKVSG